MIRAFAVLCKFNSQKLSDKKILDLCLSDSACVHAVCPHCKSCSGHVLYSSYERTMITFSGGHRVEETISLPRIKCLCGHTHAVIPEVLIPYGSYSLRFILIVLLRYTLRHCSVARLCDEFQISVSTLYEWIHLFIEHYNLMSGILKRISSLFAGSLTAVINSPGYFRRFFHVFNHSFMQPFIIKTTLSGPPDVS